MRLFTHGGSLTNCEICSKKNLWQSSQWWEWSGEEYTRRWWRCRNCKHWQIESPPQGLDIPPKVLYLDIERSLMTFYGYERKVNSGYIPKEWIRDEAFIICWSAGWVGQSKLFSACVTQREALRKDDRRILRELWNLIDAADVLTGHNLDGFDMKKLNNRFLVHGMDLFAKKSVDTLKLVRKYAPFDSNALNYVSVKLGGKPKRDMRMNDWIRIVSTGDPKTLHKAEHYCKGDVREGLGVFYKLTKALETSGKVLYK